MTRQVEQRVDLGDGHRLRAGGELDDLVTRQHLALGEHTQVEAGPPMRDEQRRDSGIVHADADPVTRDAGLSDLEIRVADPVAVSDADLVVAETLDGEVLTELAVHEVVAPELPLPVAIRVELVHEDRALLAAVPGQVALPV